MQKFPRMSPRSVNIHVFSILKSKKGGHNIERAWVGKLMEEKGRRKGKGAGQEPVSPDIKKHKQKLNWGRNPILSLPKS